MSEKEANTSPEAENELKLSEKEELFAQEYVTDLNATQAYLRVFDGVTYGSARVLGFKTLAKVNVQARIKELQDERSAATKITSEFVLRNLVEVANRSMQAVPVLEFDPIAKEMVQKRDAYGLAVFQYDSHGANKALELIGRHVGMFEKDNKQKQPDVMDAEKFAALLASARQGINK